VLDVDGAKMPVWFAVYGDKPVGGRSLWISMHGGGGAPEGQRSAVGQSEAALQAR
jgi:poly(3-hydroxybutyrate) depolymerase